MKSCSKYVVLVVLSLTSMWAFAEPWLATRYAQNCAACHAPGRVNVPPKNRRCTLSCQGCHTNPNGGGLRNFYGKWLQERWLNSAYFKDYKMNKPRPLPTKDQYYADDKIKLIATDKDKEKKVASVGFRLRETESYVNESEYDRRSTHERFVEPDPDLALARIPEGDPWRERRNTYFNAGIDSRYFYLQDNIITAGTGNKLTSSIPMGTDLAVSVEPIHRVTAVLEARFLDAPSPTGTDAWDYGFESSSQVRSAYVLIDDLPYNSFVQYGLYRPMFGNYSPDHTSLFSKATGLDQRAVFRALSLGTAPNVPFLNVHYIQPANNSQAPSTYRQDKGYAVNLGARFVTMGAYGMLSYLNTTADTPGANSISTKKNTWTSVTFGLTKNRYTLVADLSRIQAEQVGLRKDAGNVITLENRYRFWRENYFKFILENLNTARDLTTGSTTAYTAGINAFLVSSVELELIYRDLSESENGVKNGEKATWAQLHLFF